MEVPLPPSVEAMIEKICNDQCLLPPDNAARLELSSLGEQASVEILRSISASKVRTFTGFIIFMAKTKKSGFTPSRDSFSLSPLKRTCPSPSSTASSNSNSRTDYGGQSPVATHLVFSPTSSDRAVSSPNSYSRTDHSGQSPIPMHLFSPKSSERIPDKTAQLLALSKLEFRKAFLILSYIGRKRLEDVMSADDILRLKDLPMASFEHVVWNSYGQRCCDEIDRQKFIDWDSGKTYQYHCHVNPDESYTFKGPYLSTTRTHLQRQLGDENVLLVKFAEEATEGKNLVLGSSFRGSYFNKIAEEGIFVGLSRYRFFVFKDGGREEKKKTPVSSTVKCYFVRIESIFPCVNGEAYNLSKNKVHEARCLFMHVHMVSSMAKYIARLSLILSKTIKLQINLSSVCIERIGDIICRDEYGRIVCGEDGEALIQTDGTGYISEDLALTCPKDFYKAKYISDGNFKKFLGHLNLEEKSLELGGSEARIREPPLLMQVRLFNNGLAVKGTLLVNKQLPEKTIVIRHSMVKVENDTGLFGRPTFNSLEIVGISNHPKKTFLSRNLIALLSYGGVSQEFFTDILTNALKDAQNVYTDKRAAIKVALNYGERDDDYTVARMILAGIPLNEPCLQHRLSVLAKDEIKGLKGGRLPISESFYLMGTADPTGVLNRDEVCVILDNGQVCGDVLVYRNPGLHFGDPHKLRAVYVRALEDIVGNSKYAIFFSTKGQRSVASEIANGDFDGDMYWVSRNRQLFEEFKASEPWTRVYPTSDARDRKPSEFSPRELEHELFRRFLSTRFQKTYTMSLAADSWLAFMDRLLTSEDACDNEKDRRKEILLKLVDIYYDALDAPKSGKKVFIPKELTADEYPHYMEKSKTYKSSSVLGLIYDRVASHQTEPQTVQEIWKLPCFDVEIPEPWRILWEERYHNYRREMTKALKSKDNSKNDSANDVIKKYKQILYGAAEFEESKKKIEDIYNEALAIYNIVYDYAIAQSSVKLCNFAWKVAGPALFKLYLQKQSQKSTVCSQSVLYELLK